MQNLDSAYLSGETEGGDEAFEPAKVVRFENSPTWLTRVQMEDTVSSVRIAACEHCKARGRRRRIGRRGKPPVRIFGVLLELCFMCRL